MDNNQQRKLVRVVVVLIVLFVVFLLGNYIGQKSTNLSSSNTIVIPESINVTEAQFEPFWKVWQILSEKYVAATTTDSQERVWGAIQGLASSQNDPYTVFFPPEESLIFKSEISGNFEGVGMEIGLKDGILTVVAPLKGSPAELAGVRAGDKIVKIDDQSSADLSVDKAVKLIRGAKGTVVKITFIREGSSQQIERSITRGVINIPTIQTETRDAISGSSDTSTTASGSGLTKDGIFIIRLFSFSAQSTELFRKALRSFVESGSHKLIIDLRGNPGGYLDAAWDTASWFLPAGKIIVTEDFGGKNQNKVYRSKGYDIFNENLKLVVLVDGGSASASEIFAGALREH